MNHSSESSPTNNTISMTPENMESYLGMLRNLLNTIWNQEILEPIGLQIEMPQIIINPAMDEMPIGYFPPTNSIIVSDTFIDQVNKSLPIITRDVCIVLVIAHEFGHALAKTLNGYKKGNKHEEHFCDMVSGFTLQKMEKMDLLDKKDLTIWEDMFRRMGIVGDDDTHGTAKERVSAFRLGFEMSDRRFEEALISFLPRVDSHKRLHSKAISTILNKDKIDQNQENYKIHK